MPDNPDRTLVLVTHPIPKNWLSPLLDHCRLEIGEGGTAGFSDMLKTMLPQTDGIISMLMDPINAGILEKAPRLKVISNYAAGLDNIDLPECTRRGIPVGHTPGILTAATADLTMALLLSAARGIKRAALDAREGRWKSWTPDGWLGHDLKDACLGIIGMGLIGSEVAARAAAFGMRIVYTSLLDNREVERRTGAKQVELDDLLAQSDFISLHVPLTADTRHMFNKSTFQKMKSNAILVNAARGPIIDMDDLAGALENGLIAAAALDVTEPEPLPPGHRLFSLPNCLIVPHIGSATFGTRQKMAVMASENLLAGLEGRPLPACANPEVYQIKSKN